MSEINWLKHKYATGIAYKNCKASSNRSGKKKTKKGRGKNFVEPTGTMTYIHNMTGVRQYCAGTGKPLPLRGMVVEYGGKYYRNRSAIPT